MVENQSKNENVFRNFPDLFKNNRSMKKPRQTQLKQKFRPCRQTGSYTNTTTITKRCSKIPETN